MSDFGRASRSSWSGVRLVALRTSASSESATGEAPMQIAGQGPGRGRFVEHTRPGLADVGRQPAGGAVESLTVEGEVRDEPGRQLRGMQIPALVVGALQAAPDQLVVQPPGREHRVRGADGQDVGRPVGQVHAGARDGGLHDLLGVVGGRVGHRLVLRGDPERCAVVIRAVVQRRHPTGPRVQGSGDLRPPVGTQDELRSLDLDLESEPAGGQPGRALVRRADGHHGLHLPDRAHFREGDGQPFGERPGFEQCGQEQIQRS